MSRKTPEEVPRHTPWGEADDRSKAAKARAEPDRDPLLRYLESDLPLDELFLQLLDPAARGQEPPPVQAAVPGADLMAPGADLSEILGSVVEEYDEIERALAALRDETGDGSGMAHDSAVAFITEEELRDPQAFSRALEALQTEAARFELLFGQARRALERLAGYQMSRMSPEELVCFLRGEERLRSVHYLVEFLASLQSAADSFESMELPHPDIRDYLEHLYRMRDWDEMRRLVRLLEVSVRRYLRVQEG